MRVLAADVGGTKTLLSLHEVDDEGFQREVQEFGENASENLPRFVVNLLTARTLSPGVVREVGTLALPRHSAAVFVPHRGKRARSIS